MAEDDPEDLAVLLREAAEGGVGRPDAGDGAARGVAGRVDGRLQAYDRLVDDGVEERLLGGKVEIEGADADVGGGRDVGHLGVVDSLFRQHPDGGRQELATRPLTPPLEAVRRRHAK